MAGFRDIIGHEQIISNLQNAVHRDQVSHAYLLNGPDGSGKMMLAEAFAMLLLCEDPQGGEACGKCRSCRQALGHNQPDIIYVTHEKAGISVDDVRQQINRDVEIRPYSSRYKVYIVDEAEKMNVQAQNALLKTLEEPPAYVVILLLTTNADALLPTILSRCVRINLKAVEDGRIRIHLVRDLSVPDETADLCVAFAQGNVGRAMALASSKQLEELKEYAFSLIVKLNRLPTYELVSELEFFDNRKEDIPLFSDLLLLLFRDVLLYKSAGSRERLIFQDQTGLIRQIAGESSFAGLNEILAALQTADQRIRMNVNASLTLEMLLLEIKENME
ncbi:MAG: DNA polymerase III subunit delta' [Lachnospiraceae bacterium]|nr:DNA polymerase III subunit delta' [Lachnospiraceae bacterium]